MSLTGIIEGAVSHWIIGTIYVSTDHLYPFFRCRPAYANATVIVSFFVYLQI